ncbi:MAG: hypothetical protein R3C05_10745 [Pirellulaceae bacterium]
MSGDDLSKRLDAAIERGRQRGLSQQEAARQEALSEEELRRLHSSYRLALSEKIEKAISELARHFPGFQTETLFGDKGWGAACGRDDLSLERGRRTNRFSRLELTIRPLNEYMVLELKGKGTVANKEVFNRSHFVELSEAQIAEFERLIDAWIVEYAERFAAQK